MFVPLLLFFLDSAQGLVYPSSVPTSAHQDAVGLGQGFTPKPTQAPLKANLLGAISKRELFPRQVDEANLYTCGWYDASPDEAIVCGANSYCATFTDALPYYFACCPETSGVVYETQCPYRDACLNYGDSNNPNTGSDYYVDSSTVLCGIGAPSCYTIINYDASSTTWYYEGCDSSTGTYTAYMYYTTPSTTKTVNEVTNTYTPPSTLTAGSTAGSSLSQAFNSGTSTSTSTVIDTASTAGTVTSAPPNSSNTGKTNTGTGTAASSSSSGSAGADTNNGNNNNNGGGGNKSSTNVGAIAGGTVGGVAALALIGAGIGYLIYRKKKDRVAPVPEVSQYGGSTEYGGGSQYGGSHFTSPKPAYSAVNQGQGYAGQGAGYDQGAYNAGHAGNAGYAQPQPGQGYGQGGHYQQY